MALTIGLVIFAFFLALTIAIISTNKSESFSPSPQAPIIASQTTEFIQFPWGKIWVYDSEKESPENTEPIVFIHSMGGSIYSWRHQLPVFKAHQRVIAFDLLGYGMSDKNLDVSYGLDAQAERIMALLEVKGVTSCKVVACSMGGAFALWLSYLHPKMFTKVVVIAPAALHHLVPLPLIDLGRLGPLARKIISRRIVQMAITKGVSKKELWNDDMLDNYFEPFKDPNTIVCLLKSTAAIKDPRVYDSLPKRNTPTLLLWGAKDNVIRRSALMKMQSRSPNTVLLTHPEGGHHLMEDEPEWVNQKISEFFGPTKV